MKRSNSTADAPSSHIKRPPWEDSAWQLFWFVANDPNRSNTDKQVEAFINTRSSPPIADLPRGSFCSRLYVSHRKRPWVLHSLLLLHIHTDPMHSSSCPFGGYDGHGEQRGGNWARRGARGHFVEVVYSGRKRPLSSCYHPLYRILM